MNLKSRSSIILILVLSMVTIALAGDDVFPDQKFKKGDTAPQISTKDVKDMDFDLKKEAQTNKIVLIFYRGVWCPYCNEQIEDITEAIDDIEAAGGKVVMITPDQPSFVLDMMKKSTEKITFISDNDHKIMDLYGVSFEVNSDASFFWKKQRKNMKETTGKEDYILPIPATFVINSDLKIEYAHFDTNYKKRADIDDVIEVLKK